MHEVEVRGAFGVLVNEGFFVLALWDKSAAAAAAAAAAAQQQQKVSIYLHEEQSPILGICWVDINKRCRCCTWRCWA
jgi:hypothetical protein